MILDHIGFFFWPKIEVLRVIGRLAMPIFCFFAGYNFVGKRRSILLKYGFLLTVISYINSGFFPTLNILITIYLGQLYLQKFFTLTQDFVSNLFQILPLILFTPATFLLFDYGTLAISLMTLGYMYKHTTPKKSYIFLVAALTVVNTQILFWFDLHNFILLIIMCIILYYCLASFDDYADPINDEFSLLVSRNSMFIYFFHVSAFTIIRMIYLLLKQANL
ncbi:MAG: hypothetical protein K0Q51_571 [Rickettsiaceae bacterium]|nr:hypothetical protein [Rickettsiaceae bacterium]